MQRTENKGVPGYFEAEATIQLLPKCSACGAAHPLARRPKIVTDDCPDCGTPLAELEEPTVEKAALSGGYGIIARLMFWISGRLVALAKWLRGE